MDTTPANPPSTAAVRNAVRCAVACAFVVYEVEAASYAAYALSQDGAGREVEVGGWAVCLVSRDSAVGRALMDAAPGETVTACVPGGGYTFQVVSVDGSPILTEAERRQAWDRAEHERQAREAEEHERRARERARLRQQETLRSLKERRAEVERACRARDEQRRLAMDKSGPANGPSGRRATDHAHPT